MEEKTVTTLALSFVTEQGKIARYSLRELYGTGRNI